MAAPHKDLLNDRQIARWHASNSKGSRATADNYLRYLGLFAHLTQTTPQALLKMGNDDRDNLATDYINNEAYKNQRTVVKALKSWLVFNGAKFTRRFKYERITARPRVDSMHIPTPEELRQVLDAADTRARAAISVIAFGGQRPQVLGDYRGREGLRLRDFEDIVINGTVRFAKVPCRVRIRRELSKTAHEFFTFIGGEGLGYIAAYLNERIGLGEVLTPDSPLITPKQVQKARKQKEQVGGSVFMRTINIGDLIRKPMRAAGMDKNPPYIFRSYFSSHLAHATTLGKDDKEFFMGHTGDISRRYSHEKTLTEKQVEGIRNCYAGALPLIETTGSAAVEQAQKIASANTAVLQKLEDRVSALFGMTRDQFDALSTVELAMYGSAILRNIKAKPESARDPVEQEVVDRMALTEKQAKPMIERVAPQTQRIIAKADLGAALAAGARIVTNAGDGEFVVEG